MSAATARTAADVVSGLESWFDAMRVTWPTPGYGGPVIHWWNHSLVYKGTGLDWRYEGIIDGYLTLWRRTGEERWLIKAKRAGNDLLVGQRPDGHFTNSRFELNPGIGGTPHEVACDVALLSLTRELAQIEQPEAEHYLEGAKRNLTRFALERLWHARSSTFRDSTDGITFVPNKAATFVEAILLLAELTGDDSLMQHYAVPTGAKILDMQVRGEGDKLDGAIAQNRHGNRMVESYFPIYIARCIPAMLQLAERTGDEDLRSGAFAAVSFLDRVRETDGGFPMVLYPRGRRNRYPRWIAGTGDVIRAMDIARQHGARVDPNPTISWLCRGARPDGRIATAEGFGKLVPWISRRERRIGEVGVVGWCDKAFRALAVHADPSALTAASPDVAAPQSADQFYSPSVVR